MGKMRKIAVLDLETTGLDVKNDRITECSVLTADADTGRVIDLFTSLIFDETLPAPLDNAPFYPGTKIAYSDLKEYGRLPQAVLTKALTLMSSCEHIVGHNIRDFDWPFLTHEFKRILGWGEDKLGNPSLIDTRFDLPLAADKRERRLSNMAAEHGFVNPFAHRALFDNATCFKMLMVYGLDATLAYRAIRDKIILLRFPFHGYEWLREYVKRDPLRFGWHKPGKVWYRRQKENEVAPIL
jgi:DNA polymerase-3 subunit epsilon